MIEGVAKLAPSRFLDDFRQDLTFGVNPHTLESRGFMPNVKDWQKRQKSAGGSFVIPSLRRIFFRSAIFRPLHDQFKEKRHQDDGKNCGRDHAPKDTCAYRVAAGGAGARA